MTSSTYNEITTAFQDEGFAPHPDCTWDDGSVRRTRTQQFLEAVNWRDPDHVVRALRVFERLIESFDDQYREPLRKSLRRDGFQLDAYGEITREGGPPLLSDSLAGLRDPAAILDNLDRIQRATDTDPALAVGSAKELIESTAKTVLSEVGQPVDDRDDLPELVRQTQKALGLHPSSTTVGPDGSDAVKKILGAVSGVAIGVAELRNRGYGTGHGAGSTTQTGLRHRHARLAVNASVTWCQLVLDTLGDPEAPWRKRQRT